jgi:hypothetical protein
MAGVDACPSDSVVGEDGEHKQRQEQGPREVQQQTLTGRQKKQWQEQQQAVETRRIFFNAPFEIKLRRMGHPAVFE